MRRKNQENEQVWTRAKEKAPPAILADKSQKLQDAGKLCREWACVNQNDGLFNLGGGQLAMVIPGFNNQVGGYRYLHALVQLGVIALVERSNTEGVTNRWRYLLKD